MKNKVLLLSLSLVLNYLSGMTPAELMQMGGAAAGAPVPSPAAVNTAGKDIIPTIASCMPHRLDQMRWAIALGRRGQALREQIKKDFCDELDALMEKCSADGILFYPPVEDTTDEAVALRKLRKDPSTLLYFIKQKNIRPQLVNGYVTPLHVSAGNNDAVGLRVLVRFFPAGVNSQDHRRFTPLHYAVCRGDEETVRALIESADIDVNLPDGGGLTPLHYAAQEGHLEVVKALMEESDIDINAQSLRSETPWHLAYNNGHTRVCALLAADPRYHHVPAGEEGGELPGELDARLEALAEEEPPLLRKG